VVIASVEAVSGRVNDPDVPPSESRVGWIAVRLVRTPLAAADPVPDGPLLNVS
jgi:hypothetical protein